MTADPYTISPGEPLRKAVALLEDHHIDGLPVIDEKRKVVGLITKSRLMKCFVDGVSPESPVYEVMTQSVITIGRDHLISEASQIPVGRLPVVNEEGTLVGILTRTDILRSYSYHLARMKEAVNASETLNTILESAYEGIAVVDSEGIILEFNDAYCRFLGKKREEVIGRHVTEVIENTRIHIVVKTGVPERGYIQRIHGHNMVVHRIPIRKDGKVIGAIGMLIFEGVTELYNILGRMQELSRQVEKNAVPSKSTSHGFDRIIGQSDEMLSLKAVARKAAGSPSTILITGESGTGKELLANAIHELSSFSEGPFISMNCAAIPEQLLEAELFGYEEGAFTGARKGGKPGKFELAHKGTLFLDEVGDMSPLMQSKILRVLQDREVERVGGVAKHHVDVRIVAATNRPLEEMVKEGKFREDLYYRLNIIRLRIPPLRQRKSDIPMLLLHHLESFCSRFGIPQKYFTPEAISILTNYDWPGNIRELVNAVEMLVSLVDSQEIGAGDLPSQYCKNGSISLTPVQAVLPAYPEVNQYRETPLHQVKHKVLEQEKEVIWMVLSEVNGNKAEAARRLGIQRSTLYEKLKKYGLM
ncbi:sigma 54-interacting transcriptional regulator [Aneurinibacillus sp. Ricciae_BoGa-3]|uniref:sigma-54-dependent Fis family transcriptional regulator n=1 Tax=Aneurinibacillus sp. Ricciae_BoGa-3 TaxID=3022697 RepID=UPI002341FE99|nr:sigma-54-dependent Fis family transcriptional regulator [Aneurinibacillus sp. Ricciae_BoGa-3]WCK56894.1 sigma 54-interacting transcriptional regulator [Aneurinibacillus sp. Ricciae_BoGa-3]